MGLSNGLLLLNPKRLFLFLCSVAYCKLGDKAGSKLAEVLPHTKLVNLK